MKKSLVVFVRTTYLSDAGGGVRVYTHDESLFKALGAAKLLRVQPVVFRMAPSTKLVIKAWESCWDGARPSQLQPGGSPFHTSADITALRPPPYTITGPFGSTMELTLEVSHTAAGQGDWDGLLAVTLVMEE